MPKLSIKEVVGREAKAQARKDEWRSIYEDCYEFGWQRSRKEKRQESVRRWPNRFLPPNFIIKPKKETMKKVMRLIIIAALHFS